MKDQVLLFVGLFLLASLGTTVLAQAVPTGKTIEKIVEAKQAVLNNELEELKTLKEKLNVVKAELSTAKNWKDFATARWIVGVSLVGISGFSPVVITYQDKVWTAKRKVAVLVAMLASAGLALEGMLTEAEWHDERIPKIGRLLGAASRAVKTLEAQIKKDLESLDELKKKLKQG